MQYFKKHPSTELPWRNPNFVRLLDYYLVVIYYFTLNHLEETELGGRIGTFLVLGLLKSFIWLTIGIRFLEVRLGRTYVKAPDAQ